MNRIAFVALLVVATRTPARADGDASVTRSTEGTDDLDLRLTLSSFLYRQSGADAPPLVDQGANPQNASPVHRFFGDLRLELSDAGVLADARIRQTTSARYQSGSDGGGEYEIRTLAYRVGSPRAYLTLGRQFIDAVGATKIDGASFTLRLSEAIATTAFAGAFPVLGSRSVDTDYVHFVNPDDTVGSLIIPLSGGIGVTYQTATVHGDIGVAGVHVAQDLPTSPSDQKSRVYTTSSGYWRPVSSLDIYHFALLDVAGGNGANLTNGSIGIDGHPTSNLQLTVSANHVSTDLLQIAARNFLADPDPSAVGVVQNNIALLRISQDAARAAASVALAARRFEVSVSGGVHIRPAVSVPLADGSGSVMFPEARSADVGLMILDRRSIAGMRIGVSGSLTQPLGSTVPNRSRGAIVRGTVSRMFAEQRGQLEADLMIERFKDNGTVQACTTSLNPFACYGTSTTTAAQTGVLGSWRVGREWMVIADTHIGYQRVDSRFVDAMNTNVPVAWPSVLSVTAFVRAQWRYR